MRRMARVLLLLTAAGAGISAGQSAPTTSHAPAGITRETIASIYIPPLANAPFSGTVVMEVSQTLGDGSTVQLYNQRAVMRDNAGRIFQERRTLVPKNGVKEPEPWRIEISDPASHQKYFCEVQQRVCELSGYFASSSPGLPPAGNLPGGRGELRRESLGSSLVSGVEAEGTRETTVLNPGAVGNDRPLSLTREFWYSPKLGINLEEKRSDPRHGTVTIKVSHISLSEPDSSYFGVPAGFTVMKRESAQGKK